ncbi:MAG: PhoH family protein [Planctomycetota bacterium]|nr:PhoH family protein [Planctomycetota bacterium]
MREVLEFSDTGNFRTFLGPGDRFLRKLRAAFGVTVNARGNVLTIEGDEAAVSRTLNVAQKMISHIEKFNTLGSHDIERFLSEVVEDSSDGAHDALSVFLRGKTISPRTSGQKKLVSALKTSSITFAVGPAGTGKTYLSVAFGVSLLRKGIVRRIVLVRPAVEAGEKLGFLPGDLKEKVDPYLRPLYDSLGDMLEPEHLQRLIANDVIEVAPLAFMRGRTLNKSFVILDEAQNCTVSQMKMFLTRLGFESFAAITGDITQSDLPRGKVSGLLHAFHILKDINGVSLITLSHSDIVRHPLVQKIVNAYERDEIKDRPTISQLNDQEETGEIQT